HDQAIDAAPGEVRACAIADLALVELLAARRAQDGAALAQDARDVGRHERRDRVVEQPAVAALDAEHLGALRAADERGGPDRRIHAGSVASAGQDPDSLGHGSTVTSSENFLGARSRSLWTGQRIRLRSPDLGAHRA